jgi:type VI secretion system secreted protein Hcp
MPLPFYMSVKGDKQGLISGRAGEQTSHEDEILCQAFRHKVYVPHDSASGAPTGKRVHGPLIITKNVDRSTPLLYSAMVNNERLTKVIIKHYKPDLTGVQQNHFTVELDDAIIVAIEASQPNYLDKAKEQFTYTEEVSFAYQKITWTWEDGGVMSMDEWMVDNS